MTPLRIQTLALMGQECLSKALAYGGSLDSVVASMLLHPSSQFSPSSMYSDKTFPTEAARLRHEIRVTSQFAAMAEIIDKAVLTLAGILSEMQTIAQSLGGGQILKEEAVPAFNGLAKQLSAVITNTRYNGLPLLDKSGWNAKRQYFTSESTATVFDRPGEPGSGFALRDLSAMTKLNAAALTANVRETISVITGFIDTATTMSSGYEAMALSYSREVDHLVLRVEALTTATARDKEQARQDAQKAAEPHPVLLLLPGKTGSAA